VPIRGVPLRVYKTAPESLRDLWLKGAARGEVPYLIYEDTVTTYAEADGTERTVTILGIDEADALRGQVSWISPIALTLLKSRVGDELKLVTPTGVIDIEVLEVEYPTPV